MKNMVIRGKSFPRAWLGCSPFIGSGQFGRRSPELHAQFYENPDNILEIMRRAAELGWGIQPFPFPPLLQALSELRTSFPEIPLIFSCGMGFYESEIDHVEKFGKVHAVFMHACVTDQTSPGERECFLRRLALMGFIHGMATHSPARTIREISQSSADFLMIPVNISGIFMGDRAVQVYKSISATEKPVIGKKILGAGTLDPEEAFQFAISSGISGVCVGVTSVDELEQNHEILTKLDFI